MTRLKGCITCKLPDCWGCKGNKALLLCSAAGQTGGKSTVSQVALELQESVQGRRPGAHAMWHTLPSALPMVLKRPDTVGMCWTWHEAVCSTPCRAKSLQHLQQEIMGSAGGGG